MSMRLTGITLVRQEDRRMVSKITRSHRSWFRTLALLVVLVPLSACDRSAAQDLSGRWLYEHNGESAELVLGHDRGAAKVSGTFTALGKQTPISGRAEASALFIEKVGDAVAPAGNTTMIGVVSGEEMILTISQPGEEAVILRLTRQPGSAAARDGRTPAGSFSERPEASLHEAAAAQDEPFTPSEPEAFVGSWEAVSDDGTSTEMAELEISDGAVTGAIRSLERGYYSGRVTVTAQASVRGTPRAGGLDLLAWDALNGSPENPATGRAVRRGEYMILRIGDGETGFARPGVPVVRSAEGSRSAEALARSIAGRIYEASTQASGRGAFTGNRLRLALCADGTIALDVSDLATTGGSDGVNAGDATSRRGQWGVVLLAGTPVVRAQWAGTGSSYSLTRYFRIVPRADGSGARIDGTELPVSGRC